MVGGSLRWMFPGRRGAHGTTDTGIEGEDEGVQRRGCVELGVDDEGEGRGSTSTST